jgi:hypothetical protein
MQRPARKAKRIFIEGWTGKIDAIQTTLAMQVCSAEPELDFKGRFDTFPSDFAILKRWVTMSCLSEVDLDQRLGYEFLQGACERGSREFYISSS